MDRKDVWAHERQLLPPMVEDHCHNGHNLHQHFSLPRSLASIVNPSDAAIDRSPLTKNSLPMITTAIHAGTSRGLNCTSVTKAAAINSLSARGSSRIPIVVIWPRRRA